MREFGREYTQLSRLFAEVIDFVYEHHVHRISDYLDFWHPEFHTMAEIIEDKCEPVP